MWNVCYKANEWENKAILMNVTFEIGGMDK